MFQLSKDLFKLPGFIVTLLALILLSNLSPVKAQPPACADLVITNFTVSPAQPIAGHNANFQITVKNQGSCASLSFLVKWKSNIVAPTGPTTFVPGLNAGASTTVSFNYAFPNAGNFTTVAIADSDDTVIETNENNNLEILAVTVQEDLPDLVVTDFVITPTEPVAGLNAHIEITVKNEGTLPAGSFVVQWKSAIGAPNGPTSNVSGLNPGQSTVVSFDYAFPEHGNFTTVAKVDSSNTVTESNEDNNLEILAVTVQEPWIDLIVTDMTFVPENPVRGREAQVTITVQNLGNFPAGNFIIEWKPTLIAADLSTQVAGLEPGQSTSVTFDYTYFLDGDFLSKATVDSTHKVHESDESNNTLIQPVTVEPPRSDLIITNLSINPAEPIRGLPAQVSVTVLNQGNSPAGNFIVEWKPSLIAAGVSQQVSGLEVDESIVLLFDYTYFFVGNFTSIAEADSTHKVLELNEDNNTATLPVTVQVDTRDLLITSMSINPDPTEQGSEATISIVVKNQGNSPTGPFVLEWNPAAWGLLTPRPSSRSTQIDYLEGGQSPQINLHLTYHDAGTFRTVAKVDAFNTVDETNEDNNLDILNVVVEATGPDLLITDMTVYPDQPVIPKGDPQPNPTTCPVSQGSGEEPELVQGLLSKVCIEVKNQGNRPAGPFIVEWNPDAWGLITPSPGTLSTQVDQLGAGETTYVYFDFIYHQHGNFRTVAKVDAFNNVEELNEANNLDIVNVIVHPAAIDLRITSFTINPASPTRASKATASITVKNFGNYPTESFWVQWKPTGEESGSGPRIKIDGLHPNQSQTVELESTFRIAGDYVSWAMVDVFEHIIETDEDNNTATLNVTVLPRQASLGIKFNSVKVYHAFEDGLDGDAEWWMFFFVFKEGASCSIGDETIDNVECKEKEDGSVEDGDTISVNKTINVTLQESTPLIVGAIAFEVDDFLGIPTGGRMTGYAFKLWSSADYLGVGSTAMPGQGADGCSDGRCYDVNYTVNVISAPPPVYKEAGGEELPPPEFVTLPKGLARIIPSDAELPDGLKRIFSVYMPFVTK